MVSNQDYMTVWPPGATICTVVSSTSGCWQGVYSENLYGTFTVKADKPKKSIVHTPPPLSIQGRPILKQKREPLYPTINQRRNRNLHIQ